MRKTAQWAPPGMPPATSRAQHSRTFALQAALGLLGIGGGYAYLRGVRDDLPLILGLGAFLGALAVVAAVQARTELSAGPGWLATRGLLGHRWVRTDQLTKVTVSRSGGDHVVVLRDGRRGSVGVMLSDLLMEPTLSRQVMRDARRAADAGARFSADARVLLLGE